MSKSLKLTVMTWALCGVLAAMAAGAAAAVPKAGQLDPSFGRDGKTAVSLPKGDAGSPIEMATAPSGKSYVLSGAMLLAFGADGKPDQGFGNRGRIKVAAATGQTTEVADITVDANGRILVTGSFEPVPGAVDNPLPAGELTAATPRQPISEAFVVRYLPDGERDPSFGTGGEIDTTLEVPLPTGSDPKTTLRYEKPTVYADRIAVVEGDQPVIGGEYIYSASYCYFESVPSFAFTARLDPSAPSPQTLPASSYTNVPEARVGALAPVPAGLGVLSDDGAGCPLRGVAESTTASQLTAAGALAPGLDPSRPALQNLVDTLAGDPAGRMYVLQGPAPGTDQTPWKLIRLLADGDFDTSFGSSGGMTLPGFAEEPVHSVTTDARGRVLVGGGTARFRVLRIGTKAKIDHGFGDRGWAEAGFGKGTRAELMATAVDTKGRIVVAGRVKDPKLKTGEGVGLVRFLPGGGK